MEIVERYSTGMRIFHGRGGWALLAPIRYALSLGYGLCRSRRPGGGAKTASAGRRRAAGPFVISVGNLEAGGAGKTPCVLAISAELSRRGSRPVVITRGHGGRVGRLGRPVIASAETEIENGAGGRDRNSGPEDRRRGFKEEQSGRTEELFGDEAVIYLREGLPVVVDRDRNRGIREAIRAFAPTHILLDDAYHRTEVCKDLDILLLDFERPFGNGKLLPFGTLRERASAASRAGAIVFTRAPRNSVPAAARPFVAGKEVFFARHLPAGLFERDALAVDPAALAGRPVALFSGIARPESFEASAAEAGLSPDISFRFDDHHRYRPRDIERIIERAGPEAVLVTTAKDWGKAAAIVPPAVRLLRLETRMDIEGMERLLRPVL